jgi:hemolysin III
VGVALKFWFAGRFKLVSTLIYIGDGLAGGYCDQAADGGAARRRGETARRGRTVLHRRSAVFYLWKRLPYHHAVWHLFVLGGSACHWAAVFCYVVPAAG